MRQPLQPPKGDYLHVSSVTRGIMYLEDTFTIAIYFAIELHIPYRNMET